MSEDLLKRYFASVKVLSEQVGISSSFLSNVVYMQHVMVLQMSQLENRTEQVET